MDACAEQQIVVQWTYIDVSGGESREGRSR
jgi:hypothetical protein